MRPRNMRVIDAVKELAWGRPRTKEDNAVREARETGRVKGRFWELLEQGWRLESTGVAEQSLGGGGGHSA